MIVNKYIIAFLFSVAGFYLTAQSSFQEQISRIQNSRKVSLDTTKIYIEETRELFKDSLKICDNQAAFFRQVFFYHYFNSDYLNSAIILRDSLLPVQIQCYPENDYRIALSNYNLGKVFSNLHDFNKSKLFYTECIQILNRLNENSGRVAHKYGAIGQFYLDQEDYEKGLYYLKKAEIIYDQNQDFGSRYIMFMHSKGTGERLMKQYDRSIKTFEKCIGKLNQSTNNDPTHKSRVYHDLSISEFESNKISRAKEHINKAIQLSKERNFSLLLSLHYDFLANIYTSEKQYEKAIETYFKSNELIIDPSNNANIEQISGSFENLAGAYCGQGELQKGLATYQTGMKYLSPDLESNVLINPKIQNSAIISKTYLRRQLGLKAKALFEMGVEQKEKTHFMSAIDAIQKYDSLTVILLNEDWGEKSHLSLIQIANEYYKYALFAALELEQLDSKEKYTQTVYEMISKLKARLLSRGIIQKDIKAKNLNDSLLILDKSYLSKISRINTSLLQAEKEGSKFHIDSLFEIYFKEVENYNLFKSKTENINSTTFDFEKNKLSKIHESLDGQTAIIEYFLSDGQIVSFLITKDEFKINRNNFDLVELENQIQKLKNGGSIAKEFCSIILGGLGDLDSSIQKLVIIPDHELLALPFEALVSQDGSFLLEQFELLYEYSMDFWLAHSKNTNSNTSLLALASNYETASFSKIKENKFFNPEEIKFSSLNFAIEEIEYEHQKLKGNTWLNSQATKKKFLDNLESAGIIHLGLHGLLNNENPDQSGLLFHPEEEHNVEDFLLTSAEIYNLNMNPSITILSACNSGAGKLHDGDGLRSIARSFIHAGSKSILISLWEAPDVSTKEIIHNFYGYLNEGSPMSYALQQAKLDYISNATPSFKRPQYWAHLVLVGDAPPLIQDDNMMLYLLPVLVLIIGLFYFRRRG